MTYKEEIRDLFAIADEYYLAHCISADFALGAGIAVEFDKRYDMRRKLSSGYPQYLQYMKCYHILGECILIDRVFNLVTKERYFQKPTYKSMKQALMRMKKLCIAKNIKKIAMPLIGCGLDRLQWEKVSEIVQEVFKDIDIEIVVCRVKDKK